MKLQHLAVIFVLIIVPISLVLSSYINTQIKTIEKQTKYTTMLINSTYDAARAFQLNTFNNRFSTLNDSKMRDIEAAITTFYRTLAVNLGMSTYSKYELQQTKDIQTYTPAVLCTMYDGFYIYTKYKNATIDDEGYDEDSDYVYGLKPSIAYSCRYEDGDRDFIVNYTLDNTITVIGKVKKSSGYGTEYVTKTGHLIAGEITEETDNAITFKMNGNEITIGTEPLSEYLILKDVNTEQALLYNYVIYNNEKIYKDESANRYFRYSTEYTRNYVQGDLTEIEAFFDGDGKKSAINYYKEGIKFTKWAKTALGGISANNAVDAKFSTNTGNDNIFVINDTSNNPLLESSTFNEHRMNVIRYCIEKNLSQAINTYSESAGTGIEYAMPQIEEDKWYEIENNVCFVTFLQGLPIGTKMYNNYCVVANNTNQETVGRDSIYIIDSNKEYHRAGCKKLHKELNNAASSEITIIGAYASSDFERKGISLTGADANAHTQINDFLSTTVTSGGVAYFFPQSGCTACYDCIVNMADTYSIDDVVNGAPGINDEVRKVYLTALARCRYNLYTINGYFGY